jgi:putative ABC transport system permease protein
MNRLLQYLFQFLLQLWRRLFSLLRRGRYEREMEEEMRFHLEMQIEQNLASGMVAEEAHYTARRQFGNQTWLKEVSREMWSLRIIETLIQDLRYGTRTLMKNPGFTLITVITLALGIGANTAIFSVVNAVLLRPLQYSDPDRLVQVWQNLPQLGLNQVTVSAPEFLDYKDQNRVFERMAAFRGQGFALTGGAEPEQIFGVRVSADLFPLLGVVPALGRVFLPEEDQIGGPRAVILSHGLWQRRFGSDATVIGKSLTLDGESFTVVGVMPPGFQFPPQSLQFELWTNVPFDLNDLNRRGWRPLGVIARLKSGVSVDQANAELKAIARRFPVSGPVPSAYAISLQEQVVGRVRRALLIMFGAVSFVLLIACANVANLTLSQAAARQREMAIRAAVGASRSRLIRQLFIESLPLALLGGGAGLLLAVGIVKLLVSASPDNLPRAHEIGVDLRTLGFTLSVSLLTGVVSSLAPAWQFSKLDLNESLKEGGRGASVSFRRFGLRSILLVSEVALSVALLIGAGLMINSFTRLLQVDPGFDPRGVLTMQIALPQSKYAEIQQRAFFFEQALERIRRLPSAQSAGMTSALPLTFNPDFGFTIEGRTPSAPGDTPQTRWRAISPDYLRTMGIALRRGRYFTEQDHENAPGVAIINETMARRFWPDEDPLGKRIKLGGPQRPYPWMEIVGIVEGVKHDGLDAPVGPEMYMPYAQTPFSQMPAGLRFPPMFFAARSGSDHASLAAAMRAEIKALDKDLPVINIRTLDQLLANSISQHRFYLLLLAFFAAVALTLAAVGLYGVVSYTVRQRTHEIGVRMAFGAQAGDVLRLIIRYGMKLTLIGALIGLAGALALTRLMKTLLFEVSATDPLTFAGVSALLTAVALLACYVPARRATRVDPLVALRVE